ncbi:MAG: methionine adenosyltransferase [Candidatus Methanomethylicota archaeon]|jgi:S-adenosylmethionine synthetase|uniref:Methionine adenosyltransferase n=1 Tax=Thermoproteota archaeon TaxID=2056631 RepID=A0A520KFS0_9CREN|nr:MAG: methionine adenosyltransferase [Candidatus Verstraetearchaeota archaeon]TDA40048.1 MAG: methionine adenosyltransferase [Candidatus Verstraetearchaeota archaeon]
MSRNIVVEELYSQTVKNQLVEFVERKGTGHPDFMADSLSEEFSLSLCKYYMERFGQVLHHNVDKVLIVGGQTNVRFGGGEVVTPIYILMSGRATTDIISNNVRECIPVGRIAIEAAKNWIKNNMRFLDPETHVIVDYRVGRGSVDLVSIYNYKSKIKCANDTSFGVAFAPLTTLEKIVYDTERFINSNKLKKEMPEVGEDVKVMGLRIGNEIKLIIAVAMISKFIHDINHYISVKEELKNKLQDYLVKKYEVPIEIEINTADRPEINSVYLTVTGTSAEMGDDGETGRGNRVNGLITPSRPMSLEATAGKNPMSHVGKIYNVIACNIANEIAKIKGIEEVYVKIVSQIGRAIDNPYLTNIQLVLEKSYNLTSNMKYEIESIVNKEFDQIEKIIEGLLERKFTLF